MTRHDPPWDCGITNRFSVNAIPFTYRYPYPSGFNASRAQATLETATFDPQALHPYFFSGVSLAPRSFAQMLLLLSKVVRTHFHLHLPPDYLDPVITASPATLRLEGFSACCGVYARADLPTDAFEGGTLASGTTNVDFGPAMQSALNRIGDTDEIVWRVGRDEVELSTSSDSIIERKVKLPARWVKCFTEVQTIQKRLKPRLKLSRDQSVKLFKLLPKGKPPKRPLTITESRGRVGLSTRPSSEGVRLSGVHRLAVAEPLLRSSDYLRIWNDEADNTGWEWSGPAGRFFLLHSPQPYRAFSGEGQNLLEFATTPWAISNSGFDVVEQSDFMRSLPFDLDRMERMQSRLKSARRLLDIGGVERADEKTDEFHIHSSNSSQYVRFVDGEGICSCKWYARHKNERGPCKHILAALLFGESQS
ncbi:MAG: SWIM zinc finger family protein [Planctomycetota bacterium]